MTPTESKANWSDAIAYLGAVISQEFWIVLKAYFAPIFGAIAVISHLREVIRLVDR